MNGDADADPYLIPGTNVLHNKVNAHGEQALADAENDLVNARYSKLASMPLRAEGTVGQLQWIHHYLFQDVYEWAGRIRTIDMSKGGGSVFQPLQLFPTGVQYAEETLRNDHMLQGLDRGRFIERLAVNFDNFNTLHPFREGNGRTQRVFWTLIARDAGWGLDWSQVSKRENDIASFIAHENVDYSLLEAMFDKITQPLPPEQDLRLLPAIGFKPGADEAPGQPNVYQVLSDSEYERQRQRYSYQTKGSVQAKKTASDIRQALRAGTKQLKTEQSPSDVTQQKRKRGR
ncbi:toxin Fic [Bifidobacterium aquikefiri]|uniref:protein adenylyltransferase n=1 Tax=Bifidobacterium aquikefiri TaxID=1653207 RepID=A0A261G064_9BIFI|nr:Fic family protein [Bifidobacterium aquikefiri]OZG64834.1 toxin Fic [Bifidobacterium aquikefiri]